MSKQWLKIFFAHPKWANNRKVNDHSLINSFSPKEDYYNTVAYDGVRLMDWCQLGTKPSTTSLLLQLQ